VSRNKHAIVKRDRERLVRERRANKLADKQAKAAERRAGRADAPPAQDDSGGQ
jgi:hypothetical protein